MRKRNFFEFRRIIGFSFILHIIAIGLCLTGQSAWAAKAYVTDSFKVTLRTGPSAQNKIIVLLHSGTPIEVLGSQDDWSHIKVYIEKKGQDVEGWILNRYLITRLPWQAQAGYLRKENAKIKKKLALFEEERIEVKGQVDEVSEKLKNNTKALSKLQKEYDLLKKGAANYLDLKATHTATLSALKTAEETVQSLTSENEKLTSSKKNTWFVSGAVVLLLGLVIGLVLGKQQKKRKTMLY